MIEAVRAISHEVAALEMAILHIGRKRNQLLVLRDSSEHVE